MKAFWAKGAAFLQPLGPEALGCSPNAQIDDRAPLRLIFWGYILTVREIKGTSPVLLLDLSFCVYSFVQFDDFHLGNPNVCH